MKTWYHITPVDTLFFRGAEPMEAGQMTASHIFPPPVTVFQGALRTELLRQRNISFSAYKSGTVSSDVIEAVGKSGAPAPFSVTAVMLMKENVLYAPTPASWFVDADKALSCGDDHAGLKLIAAVQKKNVLPLFSSVEDPPVVNAEHEALSLKGTWIKYELLAKRPALLSAGDLLTVSDVYSSEQRIGIAIDGSRHIVHGKLYSATHLRLAEGITIVLGVDRDIGLKEQGLFALGGEKRIAGYVTAAAPAFFTGASPLYAALAPVMADAAALKSLFCSAKLLTTAGWDMDKGFHKPTVSWFPAGAVFTAKVSGACVPLAI